MLSVPSSKDTKIEAKKVRPVIQARKNNNCELSVEGEITTLNSMDDWEQFSLNLSLQSLSKLLQEWLPYPFAFTLFFICTHQPSSISIFCSQISMNVFGIFALFSDPCVPYHQRGQIGGRPRLLAASNIAIFRQQRGTGFPQLAKKEK